MASLVEVSSRLIAARAVVSPWLRSPQEISLGAVVRHMEGPFRPVECFRTGNLCVVTGPCSLPKILEDAFHAFIDVLNAYTLADLLHHRGQLAKRLFLLPSSSRRTEMA